MKKKTLLFTLLLLFTIIAATCSKKQLVKYEEDPAKSKEDVHKRLSGLWMLKHYTLNSMDIVPRLNGIFSNRFDVTKTHLSYGLNGEKKYISELQCGQPEFTADMYENFDGRNIFFDQQSYSQPFLSGDSAFRIWFITPFFYTAKTSQSWKLTKLFDNQLNLTLETDSGLFKMFFESAQ